MAVAFGNTTSAVGRNVSSLTFSHTPTSGSDTCLFVGVSNRDGGALTSTVTFNAVAMTEIWEVNNGGYKTSGHVKAGPDSGAHDVVVTLAASDFDVMAGATSVTGVHQTVPTGGAATATGAASPATVTVAGVDTDDLVIDNLISGWNGATEGADQTQRWEQLPDLNATGFGSTQAGSAGGVMSCTQTAVGDAGTWALGATALQDAADAPSITFVGQGAEGSAASGNITLGAPASPVTNDIWIASVHSSDQVAHTFTDWTQVVQGNGGGTTSRLSVWYFRYAGTTPNLVVTHTAGQSPIGGITAWRQCKTTGSPVNTTGTISGGTDASIEHSAITPSVNNCMILAINGAADDNTRSPIPTGYDNVLDEGTVNCLKTTLGTPDGSVTQHSLLQGTAASTGTVTDTQAAADAWASVLIALEPASGAAAATSLIFNPANNYRHMIVR